MRTIIDDLDAAKRKLQQDAGTPSPPTDLTYECRLAVNGTGPRARDWSDKPHRLVYDLCSEIERLALRNPPSGEAGEGWVLVPREPDDAMIAAGLAALQESLGHAAVIDRDPLFAYRAMLSALPTIEEPTDEVSDFIAAAKLLEDAGWKITRPESQEPTDGK
jgi:hypothetical protein